jgi:hypothetical protein
MVCSLLNLKLLLGINFDLKIQHSRLVYYLATHFHSDAECNIPYIILQCGLREYTRLLHLLIIGLYKCVNHFNYAVQLYLQIER